MGGASGQRTVKIQIARRKAKATYAPSEHSHDATYSPWAGRGRGSPNARELFLNHPVGRRTNFKGGRFNRWEGMLNRWVGGGLEILPQAVLPPCALPEAGNDIHNKIRDAPSEKLELGSSGSGLRAQASGPSRNGSTTLESRTNERIRGAQSYSRSGMNGSMNSLPHVCTSSYPHLQHASPHPPHHSRPV